MDWNLTDFLWFAGGLAAFLVCLPMLLGMLGCTRFGTRVVGSPEECEPASQEEYLFYRRQLRALGFEPLGIIEESGYLLGFHYVKRVRYRVFVDREQGVYASVYQLFPGDEWRVLVSTLLTNGWLIQTGCLESLGSAGEKYYRWGVTTRVVAEQREAHLAFLRSGWKEGDVLAPIDLAALAERIGEVNQPVGRRWFGPEAVVPLCLALLVLGGLAALGWLVSAWRHLLVPGGLLLGSLVYRPIMTLLLRWVAQDMRREDVEKHPHAAGMAQRSSELVIATAGPEDALQAERSERPRHEHGRLRTGGGQSGQPS
jgi:hypothetical protein